MKGQYTSYDSFRLVELIDECKTRIKEPFNIEDTIHGAMIVGKDYYGTCAELRKFLETDDKKEEVKYCENCVNREAKSHYDWEHDRIDQVICKELNRVVYQYQDAWDWAVAPKDCPLKGKE